MKAVYSLRVCGEVFVLWQNLPVWAGSFVHKFIVVHQFKEVHSNIKIKKNWPTEFWDHVAVFLLLFFNTNYVISTDITPWR